MRHHGVGGICKFHCRVDGSCWARYTCSSDNSSISTICQIFRYALEKLQLSYETLQLELDKIQGKTCGPVDFQKVRADKTHPEFALVDVVKVATRVTAVLSKQRIESAVKSLMQSITFLSIHNRPDFVIFGSFQNHI